jgi:hypothetical protein
MEPELEPEPEPEPEPDTRLDFKKEKIKKTGANKSPLGRDIKGYDKQKEDEIKEYEDFISENNEKIKSGKLIVTEISRLKDDNIFYNEKIEEIRQQITELRYGIEKKRLSSNRSTENTGVQDKTGTQPIPIPPRARLKSKKSKHKKYTKKGKYKSKKRRKKKQTKKRR